MSVTIVTAPPKAPQAASPVPADTATSNAADIETTENGADFASLLMGQLAPVVTDAPPKTDNTTLIDNIAPADATTLFAALGLAPTEFRGNSETARNGDVSLLGIGKGDKPTSDPLTSLQTMAASGAGLKSDVTPEPAKMDALLTGTTSADDKAAKFAVTSLITPETESVIIKAVSAEASPNQVPLATTSLSSNTNGIRDNAVAVTTPVRDQNWAGDFSHKIVWMASNNKQAAQLTLNPPQMGPIEISLTMDKASATATFVSANAEVRDAIETALPKLREMFASAGISLGQTNVSGESFNQHAGNREGNLSASQWMSNNAILGADAIGSLTSRGSSTRQGNGLVDIFA